VPQYVAHVEVRFEAENIGACGRHLKELADTARDVGFFVSQARVEPASLEPSEADGWVRYTPES
jgi:hypothetical protein